MDTPLLSAVVDPLDQDEGGLRGEGAVATAAAAAGGTAVDGAAEQLRLETQSDSVRDAELARCEEISEPECRYCKEGTSAGPLIAPCRCKGSMKYVHAEPCLRLWLASRRGGEPAAQCEICHHRYAIEYKAELSCKWESVCSAHSWGSYCECVGVGMMICCLVTTLAVLYHHRKDPMAFDSYTNYAVMIAMGLVLVVASLCTLKKITSRWWRANSVTSLRPMVVSLADDDDDDDNDDDEADGGPGPHNC